MSLLHEDGSVMPNMDLLAAVAKPLGERLKTAEVPLRVGAAPPLSRTGVHPKLCLAVHGPSWENGCSGAESTDNELAHCAAAALLRIAAGGFGGATAAEPFLARNIDAVRLRLHSSSSNDINTSNSNSDSARESWTALLNGLELSVRQLSNLQEELHHARPEYLLLAPERVVEDVWFTVIFWFFAFHLIIEASIYGWWAPSALSADAADRTVVKESLNLFVFAILCCAGALGCGSCGVAGGAAAMLCGGALFAAATRRHSHGTDLSRAKRPRRPVSWLWLRCAALGWLALSLCALSLCNVAAGLLTAAPSTVLHGGLGTAGGLGGFGKGWGSNHALVALVLQVLVSPALLLLLGDYLGLVGEDPLQSMAWLWLALGHGPVHLVLTYLNYECWRGRKAAEARRKVN